MPALRAMLSILFYIILVAVTILFFVLLCVTYLLTVVFDSRRTAIHFVSRCWSVCYFYLVPGWRIGKQGFGNIDREGRYVVIVNHRSMLDIILMYVLPLNFRWVSKKEVYKWPLFGWVLRMHGDITIERGTASGVRKMVREAEGWLSRGVSVTVFPEGSRGKTPHVGRFHEGAFLMARQAGVGILPCVAEGTGTATERWRINFRNRFAVRVLQPVSAEEVASISPKEMAVRMQELMSAEYEKLKNETGNYARRRVPGHGKTE